MPQKPAAKLVAEPGPGGPRYRRTATTDAHRSPSPPPPPGEDRGSRAERRGPGSAARKLSLDRCDERVVRFLPSALLSLVEQAIDTALTPIRANKGHAEEKVPVPGAGLSKGEKAPEADKASPGEKAPETVPEPGGELPDVEPPLGRAEWCSEPRAPEVRRFGSHSDPGPATAESDKGNQDFAFHLEIEAPGDAVWVLAGVADGVSQATWAARGARHAAGAFVEAFAELSRHPDFPRDEAGLAGDAWAQTFARLYHERVMGRLSRDRDRLLAERRVDPTWAPDLFEKVFWTGENASKELQKWFQSTLLGVALGPHGGFALFLGDGFARIDRRGAGGAWQSSPAEPGNPPVSFGLAQQVVFNSVTRLAARGAAEMGVLVTTDGVSKSSREGLRRAMEGLGRLPGSGLDAPLSSFAPGSSEECRTFLRRLATLGGDLADVDNMSVAFASRALETPRAS